VHAARSAADGGVVADAIFRRAERSTIAFAARGSPAASRSDERFVAVGLVRWLNEPTIAFAAK